MGNGPIDSALECAAHCEAMANRAERAAEDTRLPYWHRDEYRREARDYRARADAFMADADALAAELETPCVR